MFGFHKKYFPANTLEWEWWGSGVVAGGEAGKGGSGVLGVGGDNATEMPLIELVFSTPTTYQRRNLFSWRKYFPKYNDQSNIRKLKNISFLHTEHTHSLL